MAILGPYLTVLHQIQADGRFLAARDYLEEMLREGSAGQVRIGRMEPGRSERVELPGGCFAIEQVYPPKARSEGFFESHTKYIDVQAIVAGEEQMEVEDIARLVVTEDCTPERDLVKYADTVTASILRLRAGDVAIFFPADGHMPSLHWRDAGLVRKTVVKVPVG